LEDIGAKPSQTPMRGTMSISKPAKLEQAASGILLKQDTRKIEKIPSLVPIFPVIQSLLPQIVEGATKTSNKLATTTSSVNTENLDQDNVAIKHGEKNPWENDQPNNSTIIPALNISQPLQENHNPFIPYPQSEKETPIDPAVAEQNEAVEEIPNETQETEAEKETQEITPPEIPISTPLEENHNAEAPIQQSESKIPIQQAVAEPSEAEKESPELTPPEILIPMEENQNAEAPSQQS